MKRVIFGLVCLATLADTAAGPKDIVETEIRRSLRTISEAMPDREIHIEGLKAGLMWGGGISLINLAMLKKRLELVKSIREETDHFRRNPESPEGQAELQQIGLYSFARFAAVIVGWKAHSKKVEALSKEGKLYSAAAHKLITGPIEKLSAYHHLLNESAQEELYDALLKAVRKLDGLVLPSKVVSDGSLPERLSALTEALSEFQQEQIEGEESFASKVKWGRIAAVVLGGIYSPI